MEARSSQSRIIDHDVCRIGGGKRDTRKMRLLPRSQARNERAAATGKTLMRDVKAADGMPLTALKNQLSPRNIPAALPDLIFCRGGV